MKLGEQTLPTWQKCVRILENYKVSTKAINPEDLKRWGIEGSIKRELILDKLIDMERGLDASEEEVIQTYLKSINIYTQEELTKWMRSENVDKESLTTRASRYYRWIKVCEKRFKNQAATKFLKEKTMLDKVSYSMIWINDEAFAGEVFVRIKEGECSVDDAILLSSNPPQGLKVGRVGPVKLKDLPDALAELLRISQPKQIWPPIKIENGWGIVISEKLWPAVFNKEEKLKILSELGDQWIAEELKESEDILPQGPM